MCEKRWFSSFNEVQHLTLNCELPALYYNYATIRAECQNEIYYKLFLITQSNTTVL